MNLNFYLLDSIPIQREISQVALKNNNSLIPSWHIQRQNNHKTNKTNLKFFLVKLLL